MTPVVLQRQSPAERNNMRVVSWRHPVSTNSHVCRHFLPVRVTGQHTVMWEDRLKKWEAPREKLVIQGRYYGMYFICIRVCMLGYIVRGLRLYITENDKWTLWKYIECRINLLWSIYVFSQYLIISVARKN